ncbi:MAG: serine hydroxymethyltransferase [Citricoccus sp.]|nr:serine hydroxymethyltransferase [Citricoccus sp. WCRC_4]
MEITINRNAVPFDPRPPMVTSGLRIGTPALATRGFDEAAFTEVADIIAETLIAGATDGGPAEDTLAALRDRVHALASAHPLYPNLDPMGA